MPPYRSRGQVFNDNTVRHPTATRPAPASFGQPSGTKNQIETPPTTAIIERLNALTLSETQRFSSQFLSIGPNSSLSRSQRCIRGDDLAKQAAASKTKGVVGRSGNATPMPPSARNNKPRRVQICKSVFLSPNRAKQGTHPTRHGNQNLHQRLRMTGHSKRILIFEPGMEANA